MREDQWEAALDRVHTSSPCARHGLIQLKILLRVHWAKFSLVLTLRVPAVKVDQQTTYVLVLLFSQDILGRHISGILQNVWYTLPSKLNMCHIWLHTKNLNLLKGRGYAVIAFTSLLARRQILLLWKDQSPPTFSRWTTLCFS